MSIRKQSLLSNCIVLFIFGLLLIPAVSATNNIFSSSTGYLILHNGSMEPKIISPDAILSHYTYSGSAFEIWGGFQGPSPFNKIQEFCTASTYRITKHLRRIAILPNKIQLIKIPHQVTPKQIHQIYYPNKIGVYLDLVVGLLTL